MKWLLTGTPYHAGLGVVVIQPKSFDDLSRHIGPKQAIPIAKISDAFENIHYEISLSVDSASV